MKITLNTEKTALLFLDGFNPLTYDEPGPLEIDVKELSLPQYKQIVHSVQTGVLLTDEASELQSFNYVDIHEAVDIQNPMLTDVSAVDVATNINDNVTEETWEQIERRKEEAIALLDNSTKVVKQLVKNLPAKDISFLRNTEADGKDRKGVITLLSEILSDKFDEVKQSIKDSENTELASSSVVLGGTDLKKDSKIVTDVVESESKQVIVPLDEE